MKNLTNTLKNRVKALLVILHQWALSHPDATRAIHTVWQAVAAYLIVTVPNIHTPTDVKVAAGGAIAAGLSKAKSVVWPLLVAWAASETSHITPPSSIPTLSAITPVDSSSDPSEPQATPEDAGPAPDPTPPRKTSSRPQ